jgi:hypothetical protein
MTFRVSIDVLPQHFCWYVICFIYSDNVWSLFKCKIEFQCKSSRILNWKPWENHSHRFIGRLPKIFYFPNHFQYLWFIWYLWLWQLVEPIENSLPIYIKIQNQMKHSNPLLDMYVWFNFCHFINFKVCNILWQNIQFKYL